MWSTSRRASSRLLASRTGRGCVRSSRLLTLREGLMSTAERQDRFGIFGGRYVPETLVPALDELDDGYAEAIADQGFRTELDSLLATYVGRPSPLSTAPRFSELVGTPVY